MVRTAETTAELQHVATILTLDEAELAGLTPAEREYLETMVAMGPDENLTRALRDAALMTLQERRKRRKRR